ncbi:MAG: DCC1-like thiol-disulfide oxidoreductase family protein [Bacteroidota bacterium]
MDTSNKVTYPILFFDGVCNLCNDSVKFVIRHDKNDFFRFASLQSNIVKELLPEHLTKENDLQSIVLLENGEIYEKSTAALLVAKKLSGLWPILYVFIIIPKVVRDVIYDFIARNRYRWFGRKDQCMIPSPEMKLRFID